MSISSITAGSGTTSAADGSFSQLSEDYTRFMKLLVAQIQYQDPLEPVDGTEFIAQVATLTQVEQSVQTNKNLEGLSSKLAVTGALFETSLIGREITAASDTFTLGASGGRFSYELADEASSVSAIIRDSKGKIVRQLDGLDGKAGKIVDMVWDGMDANGSMMPSGAYTIELASKGGNGAYNTYTTGRVASIEYGANSQYLKLEDGILVKSGDIVRAM
ncbi:flagellar hook assembly protein FlgD [Paracoccus litorisediminis]|uniref:flagellar hook assembly protein FlgD n=1 Tax=Paracoccus litorisediminis TaxID=2006130 RepID=UPI00372F94CE